MKIFCLNINSIKLEHFESLLQISLHAAELRIVLKFINNCAFRKLQLYLCLLIRLLKKT